MSRWLQVGRGVVKEVVHKTGAESGVGARLWRPLKGELRSLGRGVMECRSHLL